MTRISDIDLQSSKHSNISLSFRDNLGLYACDRQTEGLSMRVSTIAVPTLAWGS